MTATKDIRADIKKAKYEQKRADREAENLKRKQAREKKRLLEEEQKALRSTLMEQYIQLDLNNYKLYLKPNSDISSGSYSLNKYRIIELYEEHNLDTKSLVTNRINFNLECDKNTHDFELKTHWCSRAKTVNIIYEDYQLNLAKRQERDISYREHMASEEANEQYLNEGKFDGPAIKENAGSELFLLRTSNDSQLARLHIQSAILFWRAPETDALGEAIQIKCSRDKRRSKKPGLAYFCQTGWAMTDNIWVEVSYEGVESETGQGFLTMKANAEEFWRSIQIMPDDFPPSINVLESE